MFWPEAKLFYIVMCFIWTRSENSAVDLSGAFIFIILTN